MISTEIELPPNTTKLTTITNLNKGALITPSTQTTVTPLPPDNVTAIQTNNLIAVTAKIYIDAADNLTGLDIYAANSLKAGGIQDVYVVYNYEEEVPLALYPYTISFSIDNSAGEIHKIESYLWDEDPVSSRGTVTDITGG